MDMVVEVKEGGELLFFSAEAEVVAAVLAETLPKAHFFFASLTTENQE